MKAKVPGIEGYADVLEKFIEATVSIDFAELHKDFIPFIPKNPVRVLDLGAGIGRDASVLSSMGHTVTAAEPSEALLEAGKNLYPDSSIHWVQDSLPDLQCLGSDVKFDFILASGIWHHLSPYEQALSMIRVFELLEENGIFAISLRNGPAGAGSVIFPTNAEKSVEQAEKTGLKTLLFIENQPSLMKGKEQVKWARLVLQKSW